MDIFGGHYSAYHNHSCSYLYILPTPHPHMPFAEIKLSSLLTFKVNAFSHPYAFFYFFLSPKPMSYIYLR